MYSDNKPIVFDAPAEFKEIDIYPTHDLHYGNEQFDLNKWKKLKAEILEKPNRYCVIGWRYDGNGCSRQQVGRV